MAMENENPCARERAIQEFLGYEREIKRRIVAFIMRMGLTDIREEMVERLQCNRLPSCREIKEMLLGDRHLHREILGETMRVFVEARERGTIHGDAMAWLHPTCQRITWRMAGKRACELFSAGLGTEDTAEREVDAGYEEPDGMEDNEAATPEQRLIAVEERAVQRERMEALSEALRILPDRDRFLMLARLEEPPIPYDCLSQKLGDSEGALRTRFHRLQDQLARTVRANMQQQDEEENDHDDDQEEQPKRWQK